MSLPLKHQVTEDLAQEMVKEGLISKDQLAVAQVSREDLGEDLGHILVKKGYVTEEELLSFLGRYLSIPYISLQGAEIAPDLVKRLPLHLARRYHLIPLRYEDNKIVVAMTDPLDLFALDDIRAALASEVKPMLASAAEIDSLIEQHYVLKRPAGETELAAVEAIGISGEDAEIVEEKLAEIATGPKVVASVNHLIAQAYQEKASDIHLEPSRTGVRVRYRVDGFLEERHRLQKEMQLPVVSRIKILARMDIAERRTPQDGRLHLRVGGRILDLRVATYPTLYGEKVVLRLLSKDSLIGIETLGFSEKDRKTFSELISRSHGIFLVTGPTGSGKSTTLYAALGRLNSPEKNIISIEDPVESEIPGVNQAQINTKAGVTFASALRSILRQDPDIIMIGEIRDSETAEIAVRAAITGHLVLSTLHTNTASGTISRLIDLGVEPYLVSSALIGVLAQRLVRKICPHCRKEVDPPPPERLGSIASRIDRSGRFYQGQGCAFCRMGGFSGRIGIFEMAPVGETVRKMIDRKAPDHEIETEIRRLGARPILEDGLEKVSQGITTFDEVLRVTKED